MKTSKLIAAIRSSLSLQIAELAAILGVERTNVYSWISNEAKPTVENQDRLQEVYRFAQHWNQLCKLPAEHFIRVTETDGQSVLGLLKHEKIDADEVILRLARMATERMKLQAEADLHRPPIREVARRHGIDLHKVSDQQHLIDAFTGKRSSPD